MKNHRHYCPRFFLSVCFYLLVSLPLIASAAQVTLQWDANDGAPDGYRLYQRTSSQTYDYGTPKWTGTGTTCIISDLSDGTTYYYVVRAFQGNDESGDSNEVAYSIAAPTPDPGLDTDEDGVSDSLDAFPEDSDEWVDTDGDGTGNNADTDDDGDSMPDDWEALYGLNPLVDDADLDLDGDGIANLDELADGSDPSQVPGNTAPETPILLEPQDGVEDVDLSPVLTMDSFADADFDTHARTCYQISMTDDFNSLIYERTSALHLTQMTISDLILDPETIYYWRVKFIDNHNGASEWSEPLSFLTKSCDAAGDLDCNGILDNQEMDTAVDLDADGTNDQNQSGIQVVNTQDAYNPQVAVKCLSNNVRIVSMRALDSGALLVDDNRPELLTGLISFKLILLDDATTATVVVYFSQAAPADSHWYKFDPDQGWEIYPHAQFSADRRSVTLTLEDGGIGDEDGVQNGIIIDPSGLGYSRSQDADTLSDATQDAGAGCFIGAASGSAGNPQGSQGRIVWLLVILTTVIGVAGYYRRQAQRAKR